MYEYACLRCEHLFEVRRPMGAAVDTRTRLSVVWERSRRATVLLPRRPWELGVHVPGSSGACACGGACRG